MQTAQSSIRRSSTYARSRDPAHLIERTYDQLLDQLTWLREHEGIIDSTIAGAILDLMGGRPIFSPFDTTEQRSVVGRFVLLWMWRGPTMDSVLFVSGPTCLEQIIQGEGSLDEPFSIFRALERRAEEPGPLENRFRTLLGLDPGLIFELASIDESTSRAHILQLRARLRSTAGVQLVESMIERVSVRTHLGLVKSASVSMASSASVFVSRAQQQLGRATSDVTCTSVDPNCISRALEDCNEALEREPDNVEALLLRARARTLRSRFRDLGRARRDLDHISKLDPKDGRVWRTLGEIHVAQGHPKVALHAYQHALAAECPDDTAYLFRAALRLELRQLDKAEADARSFLSVSPDKPGGYAVLGMVLRKKGDVSGAFDVLDKALDLDPDHARSLVERASLFADLGHSERALADFDHAVQVSGEAEAHYSRGSLRLVLGELEGAESDFSSAIERSPEDVSARLNRGTVRIMRGDQAGGASDFREAASSHPSSPSARMKWGLLLLQLGRDEEALTELRAALSFASSDWPARGQIEAIVAERT